MKYVRTISRDKDFFEQMKQIIEGKFWCFIEESVIDFLKKEAGCYMTDSVHKRINFSFGGQDISVEYTSGEVWHRMRWLRTCDREIYVCKNPEEVIFITME